MEEIEHPVDPSAHAVPESEPEETGHGVVDDVLSSVRRAGDLSPEDQVAVFEEAQDRLRQVLRDVDDSPSA